MTSVTVNLTQEYRQQSDNSVTDGEEFLTAAKLEDGGVYILYQPDRAETEIVAIAEEYIESIDANRKESTTEFTVYGERERWDETPSPVFNI